MAFDLVSIGKYRYWSTSFILFFNLNPDSEKKVNIMLNKTYEIERLMKSNASIDKNVLLKKVILDLCTLANS